MQKEQGVGQQIRCLTLQAAQELRCCGQISPEPPHRAKPLLPPQRVLRETNKAHRLVPLDLRVPVVNSENVLARD